MAYSGLKLRASLAKMSVFENAFFGVVIPNHGEFFNQNFGFFQHLLKIFTLSADKLSANSGKHPKF